MPLVLALKNTTTIIVASDWDDSPFVAGMYGQILSLINHSVVLLAGNIDAVRHSISELTLPKITATTSAVGLAQFISADLAIEVVPNIAQMTGRAEIIVAGLNPGNLPALYYMDSARSFALTSIEGDAVAAGATADISSLTVGHSYESASTDQLVELSKKCLTITKAHWPMALSSHQAIGILTPQDFQIQKV